jgi:hypothetical protein
MIRQYPEHGLEAEFSELLAASAIRRPEPTDMARLILAGLTEGVIKETWLSSGHNLPVMDLTLTELDTVLPHVERCNDRLAETYLAGRVFFAARDADVLYDDFIIAHPDKLGTRLPASMPLWRTLEDLPPQDVRHFLGAYGLTKSLVTDRDNRIAIADSGFFGRAGIEAHKAVRRAYAKRLLFADRFHFAKVDVLLVSADKGAWGRQILEIEEPPSPDELPKTVAWLGGESEHDSLMQNATATYPVACSLQLMPKYHGAYTQVVTRGRTIQALPADEPVVDDVDSPGIKDEDWVNVNTSLVNPLAAAIVQYRTVRNALARTGCIDKGKAFDTY